MCKRRERGDSARRGKRKRKTDETAEQERCIPDTTYREGEGYREAELGKSRRIESGLWKNGTSEDEESGYYITIMNSVNEI